MKKIAILLSIVFFAANSFGQMYGSKKTLTINNSSKYDVCITSESLTDPIFLAAGDSIKISTKSLLKKRNPAVLGSRIIFVDAIFSLFFVKDCTASRSRVDVALIPVGTLNIDEAMLFENALSTAEVVNPK